MPDSSSPPTSPLRRPVRLAVLLSGSGSTLQNVVDEISAGRLLAEVVVAIASRESAKGLQRARDAGIPAHAVVRRRFADIQAFNDAIHERLNGYDVDLVILAGFLSLFQPRERFINRVMNVHPALIPAFCGPGFYGDKVHRAVIESGVKISGCTIHFADEQYDHGPIILQAAVAVADDDTVESLAARVGEAERRLYPEAIRLWSEGRLRLQGRRVHIDETAAKPAAPRA